MESGVTAARGEGGKKKSGTRNNRQNLTQKMEIKIIQKHTKKTTTTLGFKNIERNISIISNSTRNICNTTTSSTQDKRSLSLTSSQDTAWEGRSRRVHEPKNKHIEILPPIGRVILCVYVCVRLPGRQTPVFFVVAAILPDGPLLFLYT